MGWVELDGINIPFNSPSSFMLTVLDIGGKGRSWMGMNPPVFITARETFAEVCNVENEPGSLSNAKPCKR